MKRFIPLLMTLLLFSGLAQAQTVTVKGKVTDATDGSELPGVNIREKGNAGNGAVTSFDGTYSITVGPNAVLVFSYVGYETMEEAVGGRSVVDVNLALDIAQLQEVVVVGYGQQEKDDVTGVVADVSADQFNRGAIVGPDQLISGKIAGVTVTQNSGEPGGQASIRIRGGTSINASNEPLYVIDGVAIDNAAHNPGGFQVGRNPLNMLNPNDIANITVLKDASAAAIYGSRAANGVIIITTKKGSKGEAKVSYDGWVSIANPVRTVDVLNASEFRSVVQEQAPGKIDTLGSATTDWQNEILQQAIGQSHNIGITGGGDLMNYRVSLGHMEQDGILQTSHTERTSIGINLNGDLLADKLGVQINLKGSRTGDQYAPVSVLTNAILMDPTQNILDASSPWGGYFEYDNDLATKNPVSEINQTQDVGSNFRSLGNIQFDYQLPFMEGLSANLNLGYDVQNGVRKRFLPTTLRSQQTTQGEVRIANFTRTSTLLEAFVNYNRQYETINSSVDIVAGYSYQDFASQFPEVRAFELSSNSLGFNSTTGARQQATFMSAIENRLISFFGRVNYGYQDKYLLTATLRRDGSSRFGANSRWGLFPSAALAWRVMDEGFASSLPDAVSDLKLRAGWGVTGNQEIGDYRYLATYTFSDQFAQYLFDNQFIPTLRPNGYDPNLKWEETTTFNVGLDYELFKGRIYGSAEYYVKQTDDLLSEVVVPAGANLTNIVLTNVGSMENRGFEFTLNSTVVDTEPFTWSLGTNFATNDNQITRLTAFDDPEFVGLPVGGIDGGVGNNVQILQVGAPIYSFFVFEHKRDESGNPLVDGIDHNGDGNADDADIYIDQNEDGIITNEDKVLFNNPAPDFTYGITSNMTFGKLDIAFTLRGSAGNYVYNNVASNTGYYSRVTTEIVPSNMERSVLTNNFVEPQYFSDVYVENASFLRMDNISAGYNFAFNGGQSLRVYGTATNLFVISNYSGLDPEIGNTSTQSPPLPQFGIDNNVYPRARTFILGVNIGL